MSNVIRFLNYRTGQPATQADIQAGLAHYVECDHQGVPIRNAQGQCVAYAGPESLTHAERVEAVQTIRETPQYQAHEAPNSEDTAAIRDYLAAKYGYQVAAPEGSAAPL
ncbi:hypothetical protein KTF37_29055 [Burkholderia multivorans]|uniref:hypothetical protein n=1 Tax=Burkholderia multivorans TaxID=87883 RepID=UPI001C2499A6|nr:hypothetical protein [Burkholderia multivorans]MBU9680901.1 hypothetical protein [Burkholderia multivorans]